MEFCGEFDAALAESGPGAVFLIDPEGLLRFDANWTRTGWDNRGEPDGDGQKWVLVRDRGSGYVQLVLVTSADLLHTHPRGDVRRFDTFEAADALRRVYGDPPICREPW